MKIEGVVQNVNLNPTNATVMISGPAPVVDPRIAAAPAPAPMSPISVNISMPFNEAMEFSKIVGKAVIVEVTEKV